MQTPTPTKIIFTNKHPRKIFIIVDPNDGSDPSQYEVLSLVPDSHQETTREYMGIIHLHISQSYGTPDEKGWTIVPVNRSIVISLD